MIITECQKIDLSIYNLPPKDNVYFIRVDPEDLTLALQDILKELGDFSWLSKFDQVFLRECMKVNAKKTCEALKDEFDKAIANSTVTDAGEYIVSVYSKRGVVEKLGHDDVPLAELLGRQKSGNPGFDFFTEETTLQLVTCGEAKYKHKTNAYRASLEQINRFIKEDKHISDIVILNGLVSTNSLANLINNRLGICSAFSSTAISTPVLISHICAEASFRQALSYDYIVLVAVDFI